jgi:hypothetical protein
MVNDGGVKRGDRADTGDLEVRPKSVTTRSGSGVPGGGRDHDNTPVTADAGALAEDIAGAGTEEQGGFLDERDDMHVTSAGDPSLGLTFGNHPDDDWAANTGPTRTAEGEKMASTGKLSDRGSTLNPKK